MNTIEQQNKRSFIPYLFFIFFFIIFIFEGIFLYLAFKSWNGLATEHAYEKGLQYNKVIDVQKKQDQLALKGEIILENNLVKFTLTDINGNKIQNAEIEAIIRRPATEKYDFAVSLEELRKGVYRKYVEFPMKGMWDIEIIAKFEGKIYQQKERLFVR